MSRLARSGRSGKRKENTPYPACRPKAVAGKISKQEAKKKQVPKLLSGLLRHQVEEERKLQKVA